MVMMPEPLFSGGRGGAIRRGRCSCCRRAGAVSTRRGRASSRPAPGSRCCAADTRASTSAWPTICCDGELSVGDFVLAGGEAAALVVIEAVARLVPGVLGNDESTNVEESFGDGLLEYPQYTRPAEFRGWEVPEVLRCGDHGRVARWRRAQALRRTMRAPARSGRAIRGRTADEARTAGEFPRRRACR